MGAQACLVSSGELQEVLHWPANWPLEVPRPLPAVAGKVNGEDAPTSSVRIRSFPCGSRGSILSLVVFSKKHPAAMWLSYTSGLRPPIRALRADERVMTPTFPTNNRGKTPKNVAGYVVRKRSKPACNQ